MLNPVIDIIGAYYRKIELVSFRGKEEDKVLVYSSLDNVVWFNLLALLFHAISISGSALYFATLIPQMFETVSRLSGIELSHSFKEHQFIYSITLGALGAGILEFATVKAFASIGRNIIFKLLALSLAIFQVYTMYAGIKNTIIEYSVDNAVVQNIKTYKFDYKIANENVRILQERLTSILKDDKVSNQDREVVANRAKLQVLNESLAFEQQNLKEALGALQIWKQKLAKKYGYADFEVFRNDYRSRYPIWENQQIKRLGIPKIKRRIDKLNKEILLAQKATIKKTKSEVVADYEKQIEEAKTKRDAINKKIEDLQASLRETKEKKAAWVDAHKSYFMGFGLFVIFVQALISIAINREKRFVARKVESIKDTHKKNEYARRYRERKKQEQKNDNLFNNNSEFESEDDEVEDFCELFGTDEEINKILNKALEKEIELNKDEAKYLDFAYRFYKENNKYPSKADINEAFGFSNRKIAEIRASLSSKELYKTEGNNSSYLTSLALELLN